MKVLLTGSNGFVGQALTRALRKNGVHVTGLGRAAASAAETDAYLSHDITHPLLSGPHADAVIHAAALSSPWAHPSAFENANVTGTKTMLDYCRRQNIGRFLYVSSSSVYYRKADQFDMTEETPIPAADEQINMYARTKRAGEELVRGFEGSWCVLRPRAVFGPGDTVLFPRILRAAEAGRLPLLTRSDGRRVTGDLIYIDTLADYLVRALEREITGDINLTNNQPVDIHGFLIPILKRLGYPEPKRRLPVALAMQAARAAEWISARFQNYKEPPITQFGVSVFAYSKTFNVAKCLKTLGQPSVSLDEGVDRFIHHVGGRHG